MSSPTSQSVLRLIRRVLAVAVISLALFAAAACGAETTAESAVESTSSITEMTDDEADQDDEDATSQEDDDHGDHDDHEDGGHGDHDDHDDHGSGHGSHATVDVADLSPTPSITLTVNPDPMGGWTGHAVASNHEIVPLLASTDQVAGQGHMHLFVDGERVGRLYNDWFHLDALGAGDHEVRVELSANTHGALSIDDEIIDATVSVSEDDGGHEHHHGDDESGGREAVDGSPSVDLEVIADAAGSGWNVKAEVSDFTLAPESASTDHVDGEGHMHLFVDGDKVARLYGEWYHVPNLSAGEHEISVELSTNDHQRVLVDGEAVTATVSISQDGEEAMSSTGGGDDHDHDHGDAEEATGSLSDADQVLSLTVDSGVVTGDSGRQEVELGSTVAIVVDSDIAEEIHVHGYDLFAVAPEGGTGELVFTADIPGLFEVELEQSGELLVELEVR